MAAHHHPPKPRPRPSSQLPAPLTKMEIHLWSRWNPEKLPFDQKRSMAEPSKEEEEKRKAKANKFM